MIKNEFKNNKLLFKSYDIYWIFIKKSYYIFDKNFDKKSKIEKLFMIS